MDRTFEAVKDVRFTIVNHLKGLVVVVPARFADCHDIAPLVAALQTADLFKASNFQIMLTWINAKQRTWVKECQLRLPHE